MYIFLSTTVYFIQAKSKPFNLSLTNKIWIPTLLRAEAVEYFAFAVVSFAVNDASLQCGVVLLWSRCECGGIRGCVTELLSDNNLLQVDAPRLFFLRDPQTSSPLLWVHPALSISGSAPALVCYATEK